MTTDRYSIRRHSHRDVSGYLLIGGGRQVFAEDRAILEAMRECYRNIPDDGIASEVADDYLMRRRPVSMPWHVALVNVLARRVDGMVEIATYADNEAGTDAAGDELQRAANELRRLATQWDREHESGG